MGNKKKKTAVNTPKPETVKPAEPETKAAPEKSDELSSKTVIALIAGLAIGAGATYLALNNKVEFADRFDALYQCEQVLKEGKVELPEKIDNGALLNGYLAMYDEYTRFQPDDSGEDSGYANWVNGMPTASGTGFKVAFVEGELCFSEIVPGKPADQLGIKAGDIIVAVDGMKIADDHSNAKKICGKGGTQVELEIISGGETRTLTMTRNTERSLDEQSFYTEMMGSTLYIYIRDFMMGFSFDEVDGLDYDSVVIDLRGNGGGLDEVATGTASLFVNSGTVTFHHLTTGEEKSIEVDPESMKVSADIPVAILTDSGTASAAEMFTALLVQGRGAVTVGERSFGKGVSQSFKDVAGGTLYYTDAYFTVGDWECWNGKGIAPDYEVPSGDWVRASAEDEQLRKALELVG